MSYVSTTQNHLPPVFLLNVPLLALETPHLKRESDKDLTPLTYFTLEYRASPGYILHDLAYIGDHLECSLDTTTLEGQTFLAGKNNSNLARPRIIARDDTPSDARIWATERLDARNDHYLGPSTPESPAWVQDDCDPHLERTEEVQVGSYLETKFGITCLTSESRLKTPYGSWVLKAKCWSKFFSRFLPSTSTLWIDT